MFPDVLCCLDCSKCKKFVEDICDDFMVLDCIDEYFDEKNEKTDI